MKKLAFSLLFFVILSSPGLASDDIVKLVEPTSIDHPGPDCLAFMQGNWTTKLPDKKITEEWTRSKNGTYEGLRTTFNGDGEKSISKMKLYGMKYGSSLTIFENSKKLGASLEVLGPNNCRFKVANPELVGVKSITYKQVEDGHVKVITQSSDQGKTSTIEFFRL